jgi:hypothetical protein
MKTKILNLLGNGLPNHIVATSCGVSESYISQLMSDDSFSSQVSELRLKSLTAATARDSAIDELEDAALIKMKELLPFATKSLEVTRIFQALNGAKRRGQTAGQELPSQNQVVILNIPQQTINNFRLTEKNEVIEVNDRTLVSMQAPQLMKQLALRKELQNANLIGENRSDSDSGTTYRSVASALS